MDQKLSTQEKQFDLKNFGIYKPIMSMTKDNFKEMQQFFLLKIVADNPEGITAYQLHSNYHFPRSNAIRLLEDLEKTKRVLAKEKIVGGRTNKIYSLTQEGFIFLVSLKEKWTERFLMMEELTTGNITNTEKQYFIKQFQEIETKAARLEYLKKIKNKIEGKKINAESRLNTIKQIEQQIDIIIQKVESVDSLSSEDFADLFNLPNGTNQEE